MEASNWITLILGLGVGSAVTGLIQYLLKQKEAAFQSRRQELEKRYRVVILLMYAAFDFDSNKTSFRIQRPDLKNQQDVLDELKAEWYNMLLFASVDTQKKLHSFIKSPTLDNLKKAAVSMRSDLGRGSIGNELDDLQF
jgi:myo-inositol-1-phosphate synthase